MKILFHFILVFLSGVTAIAQSNIKNVQPNDVVIEGRIADTLSKLRPDQKFKVTVYISSFAANITTAPTKRYVLETDSNNYFRLVIPSPAKRFYMNLGFEPNGSTFIDNIFILEAGDQISCTLAKGNFVFAGKGSSKLNCQNQIYQIKDKSRIAYKNNANKGNWPKAVEVDSRSLDSVLHLRMAVVKDFEETLGKEMAAIMVANCYGLRYFAWLRGERVTIGIQNRFAAFVNSDAYKMIGELELYYDAAVLVAAPIYTDFLFEYLQIESLKRTMGQIDRPADASQWIYHQIKSNYAGLLKEKLLTVFFLNYSKKADALIFLDDALAIVKDEGYRHIISEIKRSTSVGKPFYPFELEDDKGNIVNLKDFAGKVVLIDFWFTGCGPCKTLNSSMAPVVAHFKNNPAVKFVSVSIDKDKAAWLKSVASGLYTHPEAVNLYVGGKSVATEKIHPLIITYNITSFPTLYLLKDGNIYDVSPPRPLPADKKDPQKGNTKKMIDLIEQALKAG